MRKSIWIIIAISLVIFWGCAEQSHEEDSGQAHQEEAAGHDEDGDDHDHAAESVEEHAEHAGHDEDGEHEGEHAGDEGGAVSLSNLVKWQFVGEGEVRIDNAEKALFMTETMGSKGVTLVSPKSYGENVELTFKVKAVTYESVNVVVLSASDKASGGDFTIAADNDGSFGFWIQGDIQNYTFAFHNGAHERQPFIIKNPGVELMVEAEHNVAGEKWHEVTIGRHGAHVYMKLDGLMIVDAMDPVAGGLPGGKIGFRLRGTPDVVAAAYFKDIVIVDHNH